MGVPGSVRPPKSSTVLVAGSYAAEAPKRPGGLVAGMGLRPPDAIPQPGVGVVAQAADEHDVMGCNVVRDTEQGAG